MPRGKLVPILVLTICAGPAFAEPVTLRDGAYEVEVKLELPHLEDMTRTVIKQVCLAGDRQSSAHGLLVLSENNPLAKCPASNIREGGGSLTFDIACEGKNMARASARYRLADERFEGRIAMQMGGKNMTMTEVQVGRRIGPCEGAKP